MFNKFTPHVLVLLFVASTVNGSLDAKMKARGKAYFGVVADADSLLDPRATAILESDFGSITPQQSLKWDTSERMVPIMSTFPFTHMSFHDQPSETSSTLPLQTKWPNTLRLMMTLSSVTPCVRRYSISFIATRADVSHGPVWHSQLPRWVYDVYSSGDKANFTSAVETHVATEVGHYKNQVYSWVRYGFNTTRSVVNTYIR